METFSVTLGGRRVLNERPFHKERSASTRVRLHPREHGGPAVFNDGRRGT
jgi:hypothetical protein